MAVAAAISPRLAHLPGRSRISREYSQDGHLLDIKEIFFFLFVNDIFFVLD